MLLLTCTHLKKLLNLNADEQSVIEKIDIGGISLIRAAAKNYKDVMVISSREDYKEFYDILKRKRWY